MLSAYWQYHTQILRLFLINIVGLNDLSSGRLIEKQRNIKKQKPVLVKRYAFIQAALMRLGLLDF